MIFRLLRLAALATLPLTALAAGPQLVTPEEAALPAGDIPRMRGITRGPTVEVDTPRTGKLRNPIDVKVRFQPHGSGTIDLNTVQVLYVKSPTVNLTSRLAPYVSENGIAIQGATLPPGEHTIVISVADTAGRRGTSVLVLNVDK